MRCTIGSYDIELRSAHSFTQVLGEIRNDTYDIKRINFLPGDIILDIGAHIGIFSCAVAAHHPECLIYAYEPASKTYSELIENIAPYANITAYRLALGNGKPQSFQYRPDAVHCSSLYYPELIPDAVTEIVPTITLDDILASHQRVKCLKMDCEGAEWDALKQSKLLNEKVEYLCLELHHLPQFDKRKDEMKETLQRFAGRDYNRLRINELDKMHSEGLAA